MQRTRLISWILLICGCACAHASITEHYNALQTNPAALYAFLKTMPKGGELHYHYDGAVDTESMLDLGSQSNLCLDPQSLNTERCQLNSHHVPIHEIKKNLPLFKKTLHAWSMQDFTAQKESAHDHFFAVFPKIGAFYSTLKTRLLANILNKAAAQHELYMEIIAFGLANDDQFATLIHAAPTYAKKREILLANPDFQRAVQTIVADSQTFLPNAHRALHCQTHPQQAACQIEVQFLFYVRRVKPIDAVFAQALAGFMAAEQSNTLVGINWVDIEDHPVAQRDYAEQMQILEALHRLYPHVSIALHAGELYPTTVAPHQVRSPIRDAILIGHAERIGHGLDIQEEPNPNALAAMMAQHAIAVEVNLTSNRLVFGIAGNHHPLRFYLNHQVPVVLSTDDEGILRTDLTHEYLAAALQHHLSYAEIKQINRNALTYGFISGQSLWQDPARAIPVTACQNLNSKTCKEFIDKQPKAKLQWRLEQALGQFEHRWGS